MELMKHQLDCAYRWLKSGRIEGLIFHCTPLCDMGLGRSSIPGAGSTNTAKAGRRRLNLRRSRAAVPAVPRATRRPALRPDQQDAIDEDRVQLRPCP